jgi:hypothetical protein
MEGRLHRRFDPARAAILAALLFAARPLGAQSQTGVALAETLYQQARALMSEGRFDEACPKLEESYRLDPATGTLLNLASCHENQGKPATAWFEYLDAVTMARRDGRSDRVLFAQGRLAELEPKLSRLTIVVPPAADHPGLELELDGARIGPAARGVPTPVDPGAHVVEARAPGREDFKVTVEIGAVSEQRTITIPELPTKAPVATLPPKPVAEEPKPTAAPRRDVRERPIPTAAWISGGVTAGLLVGALVTGALYLDEKSEYDQTHAEDAYDDARLLGVLNAGLWIGVASGAGLTTYLYVTRPEESREVTTASRIVPPGLVVNLRRRF